jgi:hypothetical protein
MLAGLALAALDVARRPAGGELAGMPATPAEPVGRALGAAAVAITGPASRRRMTRP